MLGACSFLLHCKINCHLCWQGRQSGRVTLQKNPLEIAPPLQLMIWLKGVLPLHKCPRGWPGFRERWWEKMTWCERLTPAGRHKDRSELNESYSIFLHTAGECICHGSKVVPGWKTSLTRSTRTRLYLTRAHWQVPGLFPALNCAYMKSHKLLFTHSQIPHYWALSVQLTAVPFICKISTESNCSVCVQAVLTHSHPAAGQSEKR